MTTNPSIPKALLTLTLRLADDQQQRSFESAVGLLSAVREHLPTLLEATAESILNDNAEALDAMRKHAAEKLVDSFGLTDGVIRERPFKGYALKVGFDPAVEDKVSINGIVFIREAVSDVKVQQARDTGAKEAREARAQRTGEIAALRGDNASLKRMLEQANKEKRTLREMLDNLRKVVSPLFPKENIAPETNAPSAGRVVQTIMNEDDVPVQEVTRVVKVF